MRNTVVAIFIKNKKLLMDQRNKSRRVYAGFLMCPSGHIKNKESLADAIKREMNEELGINIISSKYLFTIDDTDPFSELNFRHSFLLIESYNGLITKSEEAKKIMWLSYNNLKKLKLAPIVTKLVNNLRKERLI